MVLLRLAQVYQHENTSSKPVCYKRDFVSCLLKGQGQIVAIMGKVAINHRKPKGVWHRVCLI